MGDKALRYAGKLKKRFAMCNYQADRSTHLPQRQYASISFAYF